MAKRRASRLQAFVLVLLILLSSWLAAPAQAAVYFWREAKLIENMTGSAAEPHVAMDNNGNAFVVWRQPSGGLSHIFANRFEVGAGWRGPVQIESVPGGNQLFPRLAADRGGDAFVVWVDGQQNEVWANRYELLDGWGTASRLSDGTRGVGQDPRVGVDNSGNAIAVWRQTDGARFNLWASRFTPLGGWAVPALIEFNNTGDALVPQIVVARSGDAFVMWQEDDGTGFKVFANRYVDGSGWGTAAPISSVVGGSDPQVAVDDGGNAMVVWRQSSPVFVDVWAARYAGGSGWSLPEILELNSFGDAVTPHVAMDSSGNAVAVWAESGGSRVNIWASRYTVGSGWGNATKIDTDAGAGAALPRVGMDSNGEAVAVWQQFDGTRTSVWTNRGHPGGGWDAPQLLESNDAGDAETPQVAVNAGGEAVAAWRESDGAAFSVWATRFAPATAPFAPLSLTAQPGNGVVSLSWAAPADDGGSPVTEYRIYKAEAPGAESFLTPVTGATAFTDTAVTNGRTYRYRVSAVNAIGESLKTLIAEATPATTPGAPTNVIATAGPGEIFVQWAAPANDGGARVAGYQVWYGTDPGSLTSSADVQNRLNWTFHGLAPRVTYYFEVSAYNGLGEGPRSSPVASASPTVPPDVVEPTVTVTTSLTGAIYAGPITVVGTASDNIGVAKVEVSLDGGNWIPATGTTTWSIGLNVTEGDHNLAVRVTDTSNLSKNVTVSFSVLANTATPPPPNGSGGIANTTIAGLPLWSWLIVVVVGVAAGGVAIWAKRRRREEPEAVAQAEALPAVPPPVVIPLSSPKAAGPAAAAAAALAAAPPVRRTYLVEDVFLLYGDGRPIFFRGGLGADATEDPEIVGTMLVAVQDFIKDAFKTGARVDKMSYGESAILLERGEHTILAVTVFGEPDREFRDLMATTVSMVEGTYAGMIEAWDGNRAALHGVEGVLAALWLGTADLTRGDVLLATTAREVQLLSGVEFFQGYVRLKVAAVNNTHSVITGVTIDVDYNQDVLRLHKIDPSTYRTSGSKVLLGVVNTGEKATLAYYFDPQICTVSALDGACRYKDHLGETHQVMMKTRKAEVVCPLFFTREQANTAMLKRLIETELTAFDVRGYSFREDGSDEELEELFGAMKSTVLAHDVQLVRTFERRRPYTAEAWFYGKTQVKGWQMVIRVAVIGAEHRAEFYASSVAMRSVTGLLAEFHRTLHETARERLAHLELTPLFDESLKQAYANPKAVSKMVEGEAAAGETEV